jgi:hypothetical protein
VTLGGSDDVSIMKYICILSKVRAMKTCTRCETIVPFLRYQQQPQEHSELEANRLPLEYARGVIFL